MSSYAAALRKIVGIQKLEDRLRTLEDKAAIPGNRGIAYQTSQGAVAAASGALGGALAAIQTPDSALGGVNAATKAATEEAAKELEKLFGNGGGDTAIVNQAGKVASDIAAKAAATVISELAGMFDIANVVDGIKGPGLNTDLALNGFTGFDGGTNRPVQFRLDNLFAPPPGFSSSNIEDITGNEAGFFVGYQWPTADTGSFVSGPPTNNIASSIDSVYNAVYLGGQVDPNTKNAFGFVDGPTGIIASGGIAQYSFTIVQTISNGEPIFNQTPIQVNVLGRTCSASVDDKNCPVTFGGLGKFPPQRTMRYFRDDKGVFRSADGTVALNYGNNNNINSSKFLLNSNYNADGTLGTTTRYFMITPAADGGTLVGERNPFTDKFIDAGPVRVFSAAGSLKAVIPGNQAGFYAPPQNLLSNSF